MLREEWIRSEMANEHVRNYMPGELLYNWWIRSKLLLLGRIPHIIRRIMQADKLVTHIIYFIDVSHLR